MRILGYPPAWMKDAEMSTLSMVDVAGPSRNNPLADEEGEIKDTKAQYNKDSLIEFPGFNAPIPDNVKDVSFYNISFERSFIFLFFFINQDWLILGMPPLIMNQQLSEAVKSMKLIEPVPYKKTKLDLSIGETMKLAQHQNYLIYLQILKMTHKSYRQPPPILTTITQIMMLF